MGTWKHLTGLSLDFGCSLQIAVSLSNSDSAKKRHQHESTIWILWVVKTLPKPFHSGTKNRTEQKTHKETPEDVDNIKIRPRCTRSTKQVRQLFLLLAVDQLGHTNFPPKTDMSRMSIRSVYLRIGNSQNGNLPQVWGEKGKYLKPLPSDFLAELVAHLEMNHIESQNGKKSQFLNH